MQHVNSHADAITKSIKELEAKVGDRQAKIEVLMREVSDIHSELRILRQGYKSLVDSSGVEQFDARMLKGNY